MRRPRLRPRTLRGRLALLTAAAVFGCVTLASVAVLVLTTRALVEQAQADLRQVTRAAAAVVADGEASPQELCDQLRGSRGRDRLPVPDVITVEVVRPDGIVCAPPGTQRVPVPEAAPAPVRLLTGIDAPIAEGPGASLTLVDELTLGNGWQVRAGRGLDSYRAVLDRLQGATFVLSAAGALLALGAGLGVARSGLRPVATLADTAEEIARTQDLTIRAGVRPGRPDDEVTRLAGAFDRMTSALQAARERQTRLIADASHELRTPLTSLRTNVDLLLRSDASGRPLPDDQRRSLLEDLRSQLDELGHLAAELTVLAHDEPARPRGPVRLDAVVQAAVERARRRADGHRIEVDTDPWSMPDADAVALERAVVNVLDNALKFAPPGSRVQVQQAGGRVVVDDSGPGIAAEDRDVAFERFWRSPAARALPGSGLGLAIVADAVAAHGGRAGVEQAPGGGARVWLDLPGAPP